MNPFPKNPAQLDDEAQQEKQLMEFLKSNPEIMKKYQEELTKMQGQNKGKPMQQPMTSKQYEQKIANGTIAEFLDQEGGLLIQPDKGFVVKFIDRHSGEKIFVNIVKHAGVDHPEEKVLVDLDNQSGLRIPMSMGQPREDSDKKGTPCKVVDVVMNNKIVETAQKTADIFYFMAQILANHLLEKHKIAVSEDKVVKLDALKYKGNRVTIQRIRARKSPKIEEVPQAKSQQQQEEEEKLLDELSGNTGKKLIKPEIKVFGISFSGEREEFNLEYKGQVKALEVEFDLSHLIHSRAVHLEGTDRILYLFVKGIYEICLRLPESISSYKAVFGKKQRKLRVYCDVKLVEREENKKEAAPAKKVDIKINASLLDELV